MSLHLDPGVCGSKISRNDLLLTSSGKGHDWAHGYYFPPSLYRRTVPDQLPPPCAVIDSVTHKNEVMTGYESNYQRQHNKKNFGAAPYREKEHKLAASHYNVNYMKDVYEKVYATDSRRAPLTMGYQESEYAGKYQGKNNNNLLVRNEFARQPYTMSQHFSGGPSQQVIGSTQNPAMRGEDYLVRDQGTFKLNDAYLTTNYKTHRAWNREELLGHPKKDNATYWECEDYPKAHGHGSKHNPMIDFPVIRTNQHPMRDEAIFKDATTVPFLARIKPNVPHKGMKTEAQASYRYPSHAMNRYNHYCPIDTPFHNPVAGPKEVMTAPMMYKSVYQTYGSRKPLTLT